MDVPGSTVTVCEVATAVNLYQTSNMSGDPLESQDGFASPEAVAFNTVPEVKEQDVLEVSVVALEQLSLPGALPPPALLKYDIHVDHGKGPGHSVDVPGMSLCPQMPGLAFC